MFNSKPHIAIIGLGYVGLPLAVALAQHFKVTGFDINQERILELKQGFDRTHEIEKEKLQSKTLSLSLSSLSSDIKDLDLYIVTVPTPVDENNSPDLHSLEKASETVGKSIKKGSIVVFESTVYPGVTEEFCGPIIEKYSGLKNGKDFYLGYSPERINPGDKEHTIDRITKVVSGQTPSVADYLKEIYGKINQNNIFVAKDIKTAEAAKVIENAQRDINIAFINEITTIASKLNLSIYDILAAANTKWNFIKFQPGLVGGHCIGVDPYYLAHCAKQLNHEPEVILAGRRINENMGTFIADAIHDVLIDLVNNKSGDILILGLTFKENIPDLRNTKVIDLIRSLKSKGHRVHVHDAMAHVNEAKAYFDIDLIPTLEDSALQQKNHVQSNSLLNKNYPDRYDCIIGAVPHQPYLQLQTSFFQRVLTAKGLIADLKNMWSKVILPKELQYWSL